jgi:hypothetical protein
MNSARRVALTAATVVVILASVACGPAAVAPSPTIAPATVVSPSPVVSSSPEPSPSPQADRMTIAGSSEAGSLQQITVNLPKGWEKNDMAAARGSAGPPEGMGFRVTLVDNTFKDPCAHVERTPKIGSTVDALATALGEIPNATATKPVQKTIAGRAATYVELAFPASLPCEKFYLWQDSPGGDWWLNGPNQLVQVWILEAGGQRVTLSALSYPTTPEAAKAELQGILESIMFDATAPQSSPTPGAS